MITEQTLEAAVDQGILTPAQVARLHALSQTAPTSDREPADDEKLRFITGFSDIFVTLGLVLFTGALGYLTQQVMGHAMWAVLAAVAWLLAEFFTRRRRMALPSIALLIVFTGSVFLGTAWVVHGLSTGVAAHDPFEATGALTLSLAALTTVVMAAIHYRRFQVPITIAAGTAALVAALWGLIVLVDEKFAETYSIAVLLVSGLGVFVLAMRFDSSDPERVTRRTDIAFWLHLLAAPLIVHSLIGNIAAGGITTTTAAAILAIFVAFGAVAVVVDRRAILVSGLAYAGYAFATLIKNTGLSDHSIPATLLALGTFVLLLSAGWRPLRRALLGLFPTSISRKLPHPLTSS